MTASRSGCRPPSRRRPPTSAGSWPPTASPTFDELVRRSIDGARVVLGRSRALPRHRVVHAVLAGARHLRRHRVGDVVHRRHAEPGPQLRRQVGRIRARRAPRSCGRARTARCARGRTPSCAPKPTRCAAACSSGAASATATRSASSCRCCPRRSPRCSRSPSSARCSCRSSPATAPTRSPPGSRMPGAKALVTADGTYRRGAVVPMVQMARQAVSRVSSVHTMVIVPRLGSGSSSSRARGAVAPRHRPSVRHARGRQRAPAVHRLHVGHDRAAEGVGARARRLAGQGRRGGRVPDRRARATTRCSGSPTWAGSWARGRSSARSPTGRRSRCTRARPTIPRPTGCGRTSSAIA